MVNKWTEPESPKENVSYYDHCILNTPLGRIIIEWKSWKEHPSYDISIDDKWVGYEYSLQDAKRKSLDYLKNTLIELKEYLKEYE